MAIAKGGANKRSAQGKSKPGDGQAFGKEQLNAHLHNLYAYAWDWGLTKEQLRLVVELCTKHHLSTLSSLLNVQLQLAQACLSEPLYPYPHSSR
jgi:hypothetical protein